MAKFNFDQPIDRNGTGALKVNVLKERFGREDLIPLWVADMDFKSPQAVTDAIIERAQHGVFGYPTPSDSYYNAIVNWVNNTHNWKIQKEWLNFIPGVVKGIAFVIDCFIAKDEKVIIQPPVYHPFRIIPTLHHRDVVSNPLVLEPNGYVMDLQHLKSVITPKTKLLILCNPHNPGGRVWTKQELIDIADICYDNQVLVISDEIHSDFAFGNHKHIPFASVSEKAAQNSITFMAPSKTFNIAGIVSAYSIIPNEKLRTKYHEYLASSELDEAHIFAYLAAEKAYDEGAEWLSEVKKYIWDNISFVDQFLQTNIPQIKAMLPEASFLIWLDCRDLGFETQKELESFFINDAKLALNSGTMFGDQGKGFMRLNVGTQRSVLEKALNNLLKAVKEK